MQLKEDNTASEFHRLQQRLPGLFRNVFADRLAPRTVVVVPGLSVDAEVLSRVVGAQHYEERALSMLLLLRLPNTRLVFVTSQPLHPMVVDYYLEMLPGVPTAHARARLVLLSACDGSARTLTRKILDRPRLLQRLQEAIGDPESAHLSVYNATAEERELAVRLGIPMYACDPDLAPLGSKSGSRRIFRDAGVEMPDGAEDLRDPADIVDAIAAMRGRDPDLRRVVVKLDEGFSGEGNATLDLDGAPDADALSGWLREALRSKLRFEARKESWDKYRDKFERMGGIVEAWVDGEAKSSPSAQFRINPLGEIETISTHDQLLGGPGGQIFLGSRFPAAEPYRLRIQQLGRQVAEQLVGHGVLGRFSVDFIVTRRAGGWSILALEINLRKGGTTHPTQMLQFLTDGRYDAEDGQFRTPAGDARCYWATDNLTEDCLRRLTPDDVIDIAVSERLHFDQGRQQGIAFCLLGAVAEFGKLGMTAIGDTPEAAERTYKAAVRALTEAAGGG